MSAINLKALIQKLNPTCQRSLEAAAGMCLSRSHYNVEIEHWLLKLLESADNDLVFILNHYGVEISRLTKDLLDNLERLKTGNAQSPALSQRIVELTRGALLLAMLEYSTEQVRSAYLLYALLHEENLKRIVHSISTQFAKIPADSLRLEIPNLIASSAETIIGQSEYIAHDKANPVTSFPTKTPALDQYTINLTAQARLGKIDQVIGREVEVRQIIDILLRRRQNNPILTGEPGVGKTAVVEGLALRIAQGDVPPVLQKVALHALDLGLLQAGAGVKGEFENRLKAVIQEVKSASIPIILFIDEAHTLIGAGAQAGQGDAANLLKPPLARGELRTIAATTWAEYKKYFEQDAALARRFQVIKIEQPSEEAAITMLRGLVETLEQHHKVRIIDEAVVAAVRLSNRYLSERQLPDKAISVLDTACSRLALLESTKASPLEDGQRQLEYLEIEMNLLKREKAIGNRHAKRLQQLQKKYQACKERLVELNNKWQQEKILIRDIRATRKELEQRQLTQQSADVAEKKSIAKIILQLQKKWQKLNKDLAKLQGEKPLLQDCVDAQSIAEVLAAWTGIPLGRMVSDDIQSILTIEQRLQQRIIGQSHALKVIAQSIRTARAQLTDPRKPVGVFLLVGPSGVGKTETALALAELLYGGEQNMTVINLSEFKEEHKVSLLLGSPPGYVGYGEGGVLTEAVRRKPYSLVLLDEVEKAHPGVQDIFYQAFDKGILRDGQGRDINFKNTVIILTSNIGSDLITKLCADPDTMPDPQALIEIIRTELLKTFKPAFLGRVTLVPYFVLNEQLMEQIVRLQLNRIQQRILANYQANLIYAPEIIDIIITKCQASDTGARNIEAVLTRELLPELSAAFLTAMAENKKITEVKVSGNSEGGFSYQLK